MGALSATELLVVLAIAVVLAAVSILAIGKARQIRSQTLCAVNLRNISIAFQSYLVDNAGRYPQPSTGAQWEDLLRKYVHRAAFRCPGDQELFPSLGSSYDWRDTGDPASTLAGRMLTEVGRGNVSLAFDSLPGWHHPAEVQVLDTEGFVQMDKEEPFLLELQSPISSVP
jgi:type II secretory pathway pseudopilin PulG